MNGVGVRADPSPFTSILDTDVTDDDLPGVIPAGVPGHEEEVDAPVRENQGLLLCRSSFPEEFVPGVAAPPCCRLFVRLFQQRLIRINR